jgi:hypothetical protein
MGGNLGFVQNLGISRRSNRKLEASNCSKGADVNDGDAQSGFEAKEHDTSPYAQQ